MGKIMSKKILFAVTVMFASIGISNAFQLDFDIKAYNFGSTTQYLKPEKDDATKNLISAYKADPTEENLSALKNQVEINYDRAISKKKEKLEQLENKSRNQIKIDEMRELIDIIERDKENRVYKTVNLYTNSRLANDAKTPTDGFLPLNDVGFNVSIASNPTTNAQYAEFVRNTGYKTTNFTADSDDNPVVNVSYYDALAYCNWLSENDSGANYRLPSKKELESIKNNAQNIWEWTTTTKDSASKIVKGNLKSEKNALLRLIDRDEFKNSSKGYDNVSFRIVRVK